MEKKKLLLVAISAGLFLVISIGAAIMIFSPRSDTAPQTASAARPAENRIGINVSPLPSQDAVIDELPGIIGETTGTQAALDPVDLVRNNGSLIGIQESQDGLFPLDNDFHVSGSTQSTEAERLISVPRPTAVAVPSAAAAAPAPRAASPAAQAPAPAAPIAQPPAASTAAASAGQPAAPTAVAAAAVNTAATAAASLPAVQARSGSDYWVQTGAFSTVARAEIVKDDLLSKGIVSLIENREIDGRTIYRVRVGPYTSFNEANYWLLLIQSIDGFEDSQIWQTPVRG